MVCTAVVIRFEFCTQRVLDLEVLSRLNACFAGNECVFDVDGVVIPLAITLALPILALFGLD